MKTTLFLTGILTAGVLLRVLPPLPAVFDAGTVNFVGVDSYFHAETMQSLAADFPAIHFLRYRLYDICVAGAAWVLYGGNPPAAFLEGLAVWVPVVLFLLTAVLVYDIGKMLFNNTAGIIAAGAFALLPGEYWGRSVLGNIDHHAAEVFLTTLIAWSLVDMARQPGYDRRMYGLIFLCGAALYLYTSIWPGYPLFLPVLAAFLLYTRKWKMLIIAAAIGLPLLGRVLLDGFSFQPAEVLRGTAEAAGGWTDYTVLLHIVVSVLLVIPYIVKKHHLPLIAWTVVMVAAALWQRRFDYYLIVPLSLLLGGGIGMLYEKLRGEVQNLV